MGDGDLALVRKNEKLRHKNNQLLEALSNSATLFRGELQKVKDAWQEEYDILQKKYLSLEEAYTLLQKEIQSTNDTETTASVPEPVGHAVCRACGDHVSSEFVYDTSSNEHIQLLNKKILSLITSVQELSLHKEPPGGGKAQIYRDTNDMELYVRNKLIEKDVMRWSVDLLVGWSMQLINFSDTFVIRVSTEKIGGLSHLDLHIPYSILYSVISCKGSKNYVDSLVQGAEGKSPISEYSFTSSVQQSTLGIHLFGDHMYIKDVYDYILTSNNNSNRILSVSGLIRLLYDYSDKESRRLYGT